MFGLEKKPGEKFLFDLEKEILEKPARAKQILTHVEHQIAEIKKTLREGTHEKDFDPLGTLLHGYTALQKVVKKIGK
jgi:hypothetical protein